MRAIAMGVHVADVLARPVEEIPAGQGGALVEEIRITAAGSAGGTALTLAKLGAQVTSAGAIGTDVLGDVLIRLLEDGGVDPSLLVRRHDVQTSASVLPIRPNGDRPALHVVGANGTYGPDDAPWEAIRQATHLHLGAPEFMGGEAAARILSFAREHGVTTSADILAPGEQAAQIVDWIAPAFAHLDYLLPNDEQVLALSGERRPRGRRACPARPRHRLRGRHRRGRRRRGGVRRRAPSGCPRSRSTWWTPPAAATPSAPGFLRGRSLDRSLRDSALLGCAAAGLVAGGLGSDHGDFDLAACDALGARAAKSPSLSSASARPAAARAARARGSGTRRRRRRRGCGGRRPS